jgi:hypothetical protein
LRNFGTYAASFHYKNLLLLKVEDSDGLQCVFAFLQDVKNPVHCLEELTEGVGGSWDALASLVIDTVLPRCSFRHKPAVAVELQPPIRRPLFCVEI